MDTWFKAKFAWMAGMESMTDAEFRAFVTGIWKYAETGERLDVPSSVKPAYAMVTKELETDRIKRDNIQAKRKAAGKASGKARRESVTSTNTCSQDEQVFASRTSVRVSKDIEREKEREKDKDEEKEQRTTTTEDWGLSSSEAHAIQEQHDTLLTAARECGFPTDLRTCDKLISLLAEHPLDMLLDCLNKCNEQGKSSISYLKGVIANYGTPKGGEDEEWHMDDADLPDLSTGRWKLV